VKVRLVSSLEHGGPVEQTVVLAGVLANLGVDVGVVCATEDVSRRVRAVGAEAVTVGFRRTADFAAARRAWRYARGADVIHAQDRRSGLWVRLGRRPSRGGLRVYTVHGLPDEFLPPPVAKRAGLRSKLAYAGVDAALCVRADSVVVPSRAVADRLIESLRFPRRKIEVIPNGVAIPDRPLDGGALVGTVTTLEPVKGLNVLLAAAQRLLSEGRDLRFAIYGKGSEREPLVAIARDLGIADRVELPGRVEKGTALAGLALFVLSSYMENCPMALLEAMAAGVPVVATRVGGVPEVADGVAELVSPGDSPALAAAIGRLLDDPAARSRNAAAARERVISGYSAEANGRATLGLYRRLLGGSR
jgi:glycosyltransferase involved in cell wall biosynthesis